MMHLIPSGDGSGPQRDRVCELIKSLSPEKKWLISIELNRGKRSKAQNAYLHAVPLRLISEETGHDVEELKTYLLGEWVGWEFLDMFGQTKRRPVFRSSELSVERMGQFLGWIEAWAAQELGMIIPRPNEVIT